MPVNQELVMRSGDLKHDLVQFAKGPRFERAREKALQKRFGSSSVRTEGEAANFLDHFILQDRLPDGRTVVDHFLEMHPELPTAERELLKGWHDVVEGIFTVQGRDG